jgi:hypothetical protein
MRRVGVALLVVLGCLGASTAPASAGQVTHIKDSFTYDNVLPAGTFCDVAIESSGTVFENMVVFGDPNNPNRVNNHQKQFNLWKNLSTGKTLTDTDRFTVFFNMKKGTFSFRGSTFHIKNADGTGPSIAVGAGLITFDANTGAIIKVTPHSVPDIAAFMCPLLGANPA